MTVGPELPLRVERLDAGETMIVETATGTPLRITAKDDGTCMVWIDVGYTALMDQEHDGGEDA